MNLGRDPNNFPLPLCDLSADKCTRPSRTGWGPNHEVQNVKLTPVLFPDSSVVRTVALLLSRKKKKSVQYCPPQETFSCFIVSPPTGGYRFVSICANSCEKLTITPKGVWLVALVLEILYLLEVVSKQAKSLYYYKVCRYLHELKYIMA